MLNQCVLVGRVKELPDVRKTAQGNTVGKMILEVDRSFRNEDGVLASDLFQVILWKGIAEECAAVCKPGSVVAVKGRLQADVYDKNDVRYYNSEVVAEKVSFISERMRNA
ncbi:MAG: single-stranded DNA-binding protein [Solobacterium sp.]|nr:single-stranded DNA-binding protein [Solobacterium sp.]MBR2668589.1 single-stranded DNA-binding protein [Solobacterium sp.]